MLTFMANVEIDDVVNRNTMFKRYIIDIILTESNYRLDLMFIPIYRSLPQGFVADYQDDTTGTKQPYEMCIILP